MAQTYCQFVQSGRAHPVHVAYHDHEYGFPLTSDAALFERLVLEINQAGLSWELILKKRPAFRAAYDNFDMDRVAAYGDADVVRLLADAAIIRNRLKIAAAIENARRIVALRAEFGSFAGWLDHHHPGHLRCPRPKDAWVKLFKATFRFMGGEIVGEFLMSTGYLPGAHDEDCPVGETIRALCPPPPWVRAARSEAEA